VWGSRASPSRIPGLMIGPAIARASQAERERRCDELMDRLLVAMPVVAPSGPAIGKPLNGVPPVAVMRVPDPRHFTALPEDVDLLAWGVA
jgi:hypothetical protein